MKKLFAGVLLASLSVFAFGCDGTSDVDAVVQAANNGNNGGGGGGNTTSAFTRLIGSGTVTNFTFTPSGDYNGPQGPVSGGALFGGAFVANSTTASPRNSVSMSRSDSSFTGNVPNLTTRVIALVVSAVAPVNENVPVNTTIPLATSNTTLGSIVSLSDSVTNTSGTNITQAWAPTGATTGNFTVLAVNSTSIEIQFEFNNVGPNTEVAGNGAVGTFNVTGQWTGNFVNVP